MAYSAGNTYNNNPNTGENFSTYRSDNSAYFDNVAAHAGGSMGVGSQKKRSVSDFVAEYESYNSAINTMVMVLAGSETVDNVVHEWTEDDMNLPDATVSVAPVSTDNTYVTDDSYAAATSAKITVGDTSNTRDADIFHINQIIRYATTAGGWELGIVTAVGTSASSKVDLSITAIDGTTNLAVATVGGQVQVVSTSFSADGDPATTPRGNSASMDYTYLQKLKAEAKITEREQNEALINESLGGLGRAMKTTTRDMQYQLEKMLVSGKLGKVTIDGETHYQAESIYGKIKASNSHTSDFKTNGIFDATKFKAALDDFVLYNFGGESGGAPIRQAFHDGTFGNYLSRAYEDKREFDSNEVVGGLMMNRWVNNNGVMDFFRAPIFEVHHPIPNGSIRDGGTPKGVMMMLPIEDTVTRLEFVGEGMRDDMYLPTNSSESQVYRIRYTVGHKLQLLQYAATLEEVDEA